MKKFFYVIHWFVSIMLIIAPIYANSAIAEWQIIPAQSHLTFTATQNGAPVTGQFKTFTGNIGFDLNNLKNSKATITIDIGSISTAYSDLTSTLITTDWFNVKAFPKAEFKSSDFKKISDNNYKANGTLTIRDKTTPIVLTFTAVQPTNDMMTVEGKISLSRSIYGVGQGEWASTNEIKDEVNVNFKLIAKKITNKG